MLPFSRFLRLSALLVPALIASLDSAAAPPERQLDEKAEVERAAEEIRERVKKLEDGLRGGNRRRASKLPEAMRALTHLLIGDLHLDLCWLYASASFARERDEAASAAVTAYSEALLAGASTGRLLAGLGDAAFCAEDWETAVARYKDALREVPPVDRVRMLLGAAYLRLGRNHNARDALLAAVKADPDDPAARVHLATALHRLGSHEAAHEQCVILVELGQGTLCRLIERGNAELPLPEAAPDQ